jgi:hypothetical protein
MTNLLGQAVYTHEGMDASDVDNVWTKCTKCGYRSGVNDFFSDEVGVPICPECGGKGKIQRQKGIVHDRYTGVATPTMRPRGRPGKGLRAAKGWSKSELKYNPNRYICRRYPGEKPYNDEERKEFRQMLKDRPELKKSYSDFKMESYQQIRDRVGQSPWLDKSLDKLFEIAAISGE